MLAAHAAGDQAALVRLYARAGAMALSWSMDKIGPMCRSVEDCALVLDAIHGADGRDPVARDVPFNWNAERPLSEIRIGWFRSAFERTNDAGERNREKRAGDVCRAVHRSSWAGIKG